MKHVIHKMRCTYCGKLLGGYWLPCISIDDVIKLCIKCAANKIQKEEAQWATVDK